jgi:glycosyltransferase involved in cell wall biosynthesis
VLFFTQKVDETDSVLGFVCDWIEALGRRVEKLHCLCLEQGNGPSFAENVRIHSLGRERGLGRARLVLESQRALRELTSRESIDAVLVHMAPLFTVLTYPWAMTRALPIFTWYVHRQVTPMLRLAVAMSDRVLTATDQSITLRSDKILATGHGISVPPEEERALEEAGPKEVLAVGRISEIKRWETFVEAAALLKGSGLRFRLVGDAVVPADVAYRDRLAALIADRGLSSMLTLEGAVSYREMPDFYRRAFCTVNACVHSSFDKAVLESMAFGKPALTSNRAFAPLLAGEEPPLLFAEGDPAALAAGIERLRALSPAERRALGSRLRAKVEREHGLERLMDRIVGLLSSASAARRPPGPDVPRSDIDAA